MVADRRLEDRTEVAGAANDLQMKASDEEVETTREHPEGQADNGGEGMPPAVSKRAIYFAETGDSSF